MVQGKQSLQIGNRIHFDVQHKFCVGNPANRANRKLGFRWIWKPCQPEQIRLSVGEIHRLVAVGLFPELPGQVCGQGTKVSCVDDAAAQRFLQQGPPGVVERLAALFQPMRLQPG